MIMEWILTHIELVLASIVTPILGWLLYDRHKNKITLESMAKELESKQVAIDTDKFASMQKQIMVFESLIETLHTQFEKMQQFYKQDVIDLENRIKKMSEAHDSEIKKYIDQILSLTKQIARLKEELKEERKNAKCK